MGSSNNVFLAFLYLGFGPNYLANSYVLRTRSPLCFYSNLKTTFDLHVLTFILSQDQTLSFEYDFLHRSRFWTYQIFNIKPLCITKQIIIIIKLTTHRPISIDYVELLVYLTRYTFALRNYIVIIDCKYDI